MYVPKLRYVPDMMLSLAQEGDAWIIFNQATERTHDTRHRPGQLGVLAKVETVTRTRNQFA